MAAYKPCSISSSWPFQLSRTGGIGPHILYSRAASREASAFPFEVLTVSDDNLKIIDMIYVSRGLRVSHDRKYYAAARMVSLLTPESFSLTTSSPPLFDMFKNWGRLSLSSCDETEVLYTPLILQVHEPFENCGHNSDLQNFANSVQAKYFVHLVFHPLTVMSRLSLSTAGHFKLTKISTVSDTASQFQVDLKALFRRPAPLAPAASAFDSAISPSQAVMSRERLVALRLENMTAGVNMDENGNGKSAMRWRWSVSRNVLDQSKQLTTNFISMSTDSSKTGELIPNSPAFVWLSHILRSIPSWDEHVGMKVFCNRQLKISLLRCSRIGNST